MDAGIRPRRQLRVFISSTFADMNAERDSLTRIFPQISALCKKRNVEFVPVDLRWGITESAAREGHVLDTCMREIDNSRPFFIGIIGNRYGWVPSESDFGLMSESLKHRYIWLSKALEEGLSITEMEMRYAALASDDNSINAAFFIRNDSVAVDEAFRELPGSDSERKLQKLKDKIRSQSRFGVSGFSSPEDLGTKVLDVLTAFLDKEFPATDVESYDTSHIEQETVLASRSKSLFSLSRYDAEWRKWVDDPSKQWLSITGHTGRGKSYLLCHIVTQLRRRPDNPVVVYYDCTDEDASETLENIIADILCELGVRSRKGSDRAGMMGCFLSLLWMMIKMPFLAIAMLFRYALGNQEEAGKRFGNTVAELIINCKTQSTRSAYAKLTKTLRKAPSRPVFVALDNFDARTEDDMMLLTLMSELPHVRFLSTADTGSKMQLHLMGLIKAETLTVQNLDVNQSREFVTRYLEKYGKRLDEQGVQRDRIVNSKIGGVPQLLSHVLSLMVSFGSFEELDRYITDLSSIQNPKELYVLLMRNIDEQFRDGWVAAKAFVALASVPPGLTEEELKKIISPTPLAWATLRPYILNLCKMRGMWLYLPTAEHREAALEVHGGRADEVRSDIAAHFEAKLRELVNHKDKLGNPDTDRFIDDMLLLKRQVEVLMPLYYNAHRLKELYSWATYLQADKLISESERIEYWKALFAGGYTMRGAPDPDLSPWAKRGRAVYSIANYLEYRREVDVVKTDKEERDEMYQRWVYVAGLCSANEDILWLNRKLTTSQKFDKESQEAVTKVQTLYTQKRYDEIIACSPGPLPSKLHQAMVDFYVSLAYMEKGNHKEAFARIQESIGFVKRFGLLLEEGYLPVIMHYCRYVSSMDSDDVKMMFDVMEYHRERQLAGGLDNHNSFMVLRSLTELYFGTGQYDKALEAGRLWRESALALKVPVGQIDASLAEIERRLQG